MYNAMLTEDVVKPAGQHIIVGRQAIILLQCSQYFWKLVTYFM